MFPREEVKNRQALKVNIPPSIAKIFVALGTRSIHRNAFKSFDAESVNQVSRAPLVKSDLRSSMLKKISKSRILINGILNLIAFF